MRTCRSSLLAIALVGTLPSVSLATADLRFDVVTFNATPEGSADHMNQTLFDELNFTTTNGHTILMGSDTHRPELNTAGNTLGAYYNTWTNLYNGQSTKDGFAAADVINAYVSGFTTNGARPTWVALNELSGSLWPNNATYRQWTINCTTKLHDTYGYEVIAYSPFPNPAANGTSWQALSAKAYIGIEYYLSGEEVKVQNFSLSWVQAQYQSAITSYSNRGVPKSRMILGEEFASTTAGTGWGRAGVSATDWEATIRVRSQAIYNLNFPGFIGYAWGKNAMGLSDANLQYAEAVYASTMVVQTETPHWLPSGGGSWNVRNNWLAYSTLPNNPGDAATFNGNITTSSATITLDGGKTVGTLTFNNPHPITITPGTGGTLTLNNNAAAPVITVLQGSHKITAALAFAAPATLSIAAGAKLDVTTNTLLLSSVTTPVATLRQYLHDGLLVSSTAAADQQHRLVLGYLFNPASNSIIVKTTYIGDANLDGQIDADDFALIDRGFAKRLGTWSDGDFNYDGVVTSADYFQIDRTYFQQGAPLSPGYLALRESQFGADYVSDLLVSIPEPSLISCILVGGVLMVGGRRRVA